MASTWGNSWGTSWLTSWDGAYVPTTTQRLGGVPLWAQTKPRESEEQKRTRRIAQGIIRDAQKPSADIAKLSRKAANVSEQLRADVAHYEAEAAKYATEIEQIALVMQARNNALATKQLEQRMIQAQLQAEAAAQQVEELDVVFMAVMLAVME